MTCETWKLKQRHSQGWFGLRALELGLDDAEPEGKTRPGDVGSLDQREGFWWPDGSSLNLLTWPKKSRTHLQCNQIILSWRHSTMNRCRKEVLLEPSLAAPKRVSQKMSTLVNSPSRKASCTLENELPSARQQEGKPPEQTLSQIYPTCDECSWRAINPS